MRIIRRSKMKNLLIIAVCILCVFVFLQAGGDSVSNAAVEKTKAVDKLAVVWTSGDKAVAERVCFMYVHNAKKAKWFDEVEMIVWGPSAKLLSEDAALQKAVKQMLKDGVKIRACKACADSYGVSGKLSELGIEVKYMGRPLSNILKTDWKVLTF